MFFENWNRIGAFIIDTWVGIVLFQLIVTILLQFDFFFNLLLVTFNNLATDVIAVVFHLLLVIGSLALANSLLTKFFGNTFGKYILKVNVVYKDLISENDLKRINKQHKKALLKTEKTMNKNQKMKKNNINKIYGIKTKPKFLKGFKREFTKYYLFVLSFTLYGIYYLYKLMRGNKVTYHDKYNNTEVEVWK